MGLINFFLPPMIPLAPTRIRSNSRFLITGIHAVLKTAVYNRGVAPVVSDIFGADICRT